MSSPYFSQETKDTLAARSAMICNNPSCACVTVGPSDAAGDLKLKLGEAAHICAAKPNEARFDPVMDNDQRSAIENGIWLCANCHTMIDKNNGADFSKELISDWKRQHEQVILTLLRTHRSPLPMLRKFTDEGKIAQDIVDFLEGHGALYKSFNQENNEYVIKSFDRIRSEISLKLKEIRYDLQLKELLKDLRAEFQRYMNFTGNFSTNSWSELQSIRNHVGVILGRLRDEYGCRIYGELNRIL